MKRDNRISRKKRATGGPRAPTTVNRPMRSVRTMIIPNEYDVWLKWTYGQTITSAAAFANRRFQPNGTYDVDPVFASTSTPGFVEMSALFARYRVIKYKYVHKLSNHEAFPVLAVILNTNTDPGTGASLVPKAGNQFAHTALLDAVGGGHAGRELHGAHSVCQIVGSITPETDENYSALVTSNPADLVWNSLCLDSLSASVLTNGVSCYSEITMLVRFYERTILAS